MAESDLPDEILDEIRGQYPPILTTAHVAEMMHSTIGDVRDKVHRGELPAVRWGQQFRFFREEILAAMTRYQPGEPTPSDEDPEPPNRNRDMGEIDYEDWYPEVPAVMDTRELAELLHTNEQIIRAWVREGTIPAHRAPGGRKYAFLRHEIFNWLISNRYQPDATG